MHFDCIEIINLRSNSKTAIVLHRRYKNIQIEKVLIFPFICFVGIDFVVISQQKLLNWILSNLKRKFVYMNFGKKHILILLVLIYFLLTKRRNFEMKIFTYSKAQNRHRAACTEWLSLDVAQLMNHAAKHFLPLTS